MGLLWGFIGVFIFSLTLPATKLTVGHFDPLFIGLGRAVLAGILAILALKITKNPLLPIVILPRLILVALGVVIGFPVFSALALQQIPSSHGAVITGILPLTTAIAGTILAKESQTFLFWIASFFGSAIVIFYSFWNQEVSLRFGDLFLFLAVLSAAIGYAEGGRLSKEHGGWKVISWSLVVSLPFVILISAFTFQKNDLEAPASAWFGFLYTGIFSMFLGFFAWYKGLAMSGIGKVGQIQLIQPFLTFLFSAWILSEKIDSSMIFVGLMVGFSIFLGRIRFKKNKVLPETKPNSVH
ncbi:DMT family transporter [Leptospira stimsonii]|uniref:DMT family transporter n=1 Tax=Leptospira stimsonii TaxID=2202203 RepID=A0ABY2N4L4_9LEPT|nr:DMT family transporter [Leptospira stimsonii]TGK22121.1 DMT family transporter [Leptospira stimsonii]TGM16849.1 DMT family transporter [Leptospira stimsonii]